MTDPTRPIKATPDTTAVQPPAPTSQRAVADSLVAHQRAGWPGFQNSGDDESNRLMNELYSSGKLSGFMELLKANFRDRPTEPPKKTFAQQLHDVFKKP